jgi:GGDEF domain-containing protein
LNRARFEVLLDREWRLAKRGTVQSVVIAGHVEAQTAHDGAGQAIAKLALKDAAAAFAGNARTTDHVGRVSDANLAAVLVGCESANNARRFVRRFHSALRRTTGSRTFRIDVTFGVESLAEANSPQEALERAETAAGASVEEASAELAAAQHEAHE